MNKTPWILLVVLSFFAVAGWKAIDQAPKRQLWEYKAVVANINTIGGVVVTWKEDGKEIPAVTSLHAKATALGNDGWELVSVTFSNENYAYWFKRPKS